MLMGVSFPLLQKIAQTDFSRLGSRVGDADAGQHLRQHARRGSHRLARTPLSRDRRHVARRLSRHAGCSDLLARSSLFEQDRGAGRAAACSRCGPACAAAWSRRCRSDASCGRLFTASRNRGSSGARMKQGLSLVKLPSGSFEGRAEVLREWAGSELVSVRRRSTPRSARFRP